jgi:hypothetical protein
MVPIYECEIGKVLHEPHTWRQGFLFLKHGCMGVDQHRLDMWEIMKAGSEGTLTYEQAQAYLAKYDRKY